MLMLSFYDRALKERLDAAPPDSQFDAWQQWRDHRQEAWETLPIRQLIINWLNAKGIAWQPCAPFMSSGVMMCGYMGDIYLDIPYDKDLPLYQELEAYLQYSDDRIRFDNVMFLHMPLELAMENAEQDEPGFLDNM
ncbi:hypothetical protein ACFO3A_05895 [Comamonas nitrativorans]|uniref:Uncharacterized protein n=1 Tax=Comamonas nitrativorans TaxID=108437 RepID=A0ABV9GYD8_9BURK